MWNDDIAIELPWEEISQSTLVGPADAIVHLLVAAGAGPTALARFFGAALELDPSLALVGPVLGGLKLL